MDRKSIIVVGACFALLLLWSYVIVPKLYPGKPVPPGAAQPTATQPAGQTNATGAPAPAPVSPTAPAGTPQLIVNTNVEEKQLFLTNENARYTFTSYGGGLKLVELLKYPESVPNWRERKKTETSRFATLNARALKPVLAVLDGPAVQGDGIFDLTQTGNSVRAEKALANGLLLVKEFSLSSNYLVNATMRLENRSTQTVTLPAQEWVVGAAAPMPGTVQDNSQFVGLMWFNGEKTKDVIGTNHFSNRGFACMPRTPPAEYREGQTNVVWSAVHDQYFALALMPADRAAEVVLRRANLSQPTGEDARFVFTNTVPPPGYEAAMVYPGISLAPNEVKQRQAVLYAGPKEYRTLARIAAQFNNKLDALMDFGWFGFFAKGLLLGLNWLHEALKLSYGWAIVAITVLIKIIFWPITAAQTRMSKRMAALQPQIKAIQEKYKDDPMKVQKKTMEFWKENKINPMAGCLPVFIQMPVFIGFFTMIRSAIELRGASFLWIPDLSQPDTLFIIPGLGFIPFIGIQGVGLPFNLLPIIMVGTMLWQSHLTPMSPGMDPTQQKIMRYMPLIFLVILYNYSAGMALYWTTNNLLTILQTKLTRTVEPAAAAPPGKAAPGKKAAPALTPPQKKKK